MSGEGNKIVEWHTRRRERATRLILVIMLVLVRGDVALATPTRW